MTKFAITSGSGRVIFEASLSGDLDTADYRARLGAAVEMAVAKGANLEGADLAGADLADAYLARANLAGADLAGADLARANLAGANLAGADLAGAELAGADLAFADLARANLAGANLAGDNLAHANLMGANLARANLMGANLWGANLAGADLWDADLTAANLKGAYLAGARNISAALLASLSILPEGTLIGWKKLRGGIIAQLEIPAEARRVNAYSSRKCRAEYARVLALFRPDGEPFDGVATSRHCADTRYVVGEIVRPDSFDPDPQKECSGGIHFFITRPEAEAY